MNGKRKNVITQFELTQTFRCECTKNHVCVCVSTSASKLDQWMNFRSIWTLLPPPPPPPPPSSSSSQLQLLIPIVYGRMTLGENRSIIYTKCIVEWWPCDDLCGLATSNGHWQLASDWYSSCGKQISSHSIGDAYSHTHTNSPFFSWCTIADGWPSFMAGHCLPPMKIMALLHGLVCSFG